MTLRHFDVIVIGRSLGCLCAAALLARRDLRVLVLGHGALPPTYAWQGRKIQRRAFTLLFGETPVWRRVLQDLAQTQTFRRCTHRLEPSYSLLTPESRVQVFADRSAFAAEIRRAFSEVQPSIEELWTTLIHADRALEGVLAREEAFPPSTLVERLRARPWLTSLPWADATLRGALDKLPSAHPFREAAFLPAAFAGHWAGPLGDLPLLGAARLHELCVRHALTFDGGEEAFESFLVQRIQAHGGSCELSERADALAFRRGRIAGVVIGGGEQTIGADDVITDLDGRALVELAEGQGLGPSYARWPELEPELGRFVVTLWVRRAGIPEPLARESIVLAGPDVRGAPRPALHLQFAPAEDFPAADDVQRLVVEVLVPQSQLRRAGELRSRVLQILREHFPFIDRHLLLADSPHDGLPLQLFEQGQPREVDRLRLHGASPRPEPLQPLWRTQRHGFLGLAGEPMVGPVRGSLLVGRTVFPGLGQEGELIAAWNAAQSITRRDHAWQKRRRQMWSKIDTD